MQFDWEGGNKLWNPETDEKENSGLPHSSECTIKIHFRLIIKKSLCIIGLCTFTELPKSASLKESMMAEIQAAEKETEREKVRNIQD